MRFRLQKRIPRLFGVTFTVFAALIPQETFANHATGHGQPQSGGQSGGFQNPLAFDSLREFLNALLEVVVQIGFPIVVLAIIWTGFLFVKAQGNPNELDTAKKALFWTLLGALLILGAFVLSELIRATVDQII